ncbi:MAG: RNA methyltransferase [Bacteroidetes bacterium]|nr:MAG: RNA methyltransferase [Bacteroidota bacterium]
MSILSKNQIKFIKSLHQKKYRQEHQMFLLEGEKLVNEALRDKPEIIDCLIINSSFKNKNTLPSHIPIYQTDESIFNSLSQLTTPPNIMAVCKYFEIPSKPINLQKQFTFYLDNINDPGNFGTIIRTCDWFGITELFCSPQCVDVLNPKSIQASKGSFLRVKITYTKFENLNLPDAVNIYAAHMKGKNIFEITDKTGLIILGNEANGISTELLQFVKEKISIPKHPDSHTESLNVAMSAAIIASQFFKS